MWMNDIFLIDKSFFLSYLPGPDVGDPLPERPLVHEAQLEGVPADLDQVVEEGAQPGQGVRGGE